MRMNLQNIPGVWEACCSEERKVIKFLDRELFWGENTYDNQCGELWKELISKSYLVFMSCHLKFIFFLKGLDPAAHVGFEDFWRTILSPSPSQLILNCTTQKILRILFQNSSSIFTFRCPSVRPWTSVTSHLISTIWPFRPHKPYIFW